MTPRSVIAIALFVVVAVVACGFYIDSGQAKCSPRAECPDGFDCRYDGRCYREGVGLSTTCDDGVVDANETCDPPESCPASCDDGNACTIDNKVGTARACNVGCLRAVIDSCADDDGCCPDGCSFANDTDCSANCDNGLVDENETCDPPSSCPSQADCDDGNACTVDFLTGSASNCNASCGNTVVSTCGPGEGCCPPGCTAATDPDCSATCGNGMVDEGETCDEPQFECPTLASCDDEDDCTIDGLTGSAQNCNAECTHTDITEPNNSDGCCPPGGTPATDDDCVGVCVEDGCCDFQAGENEQNCPSDCTEPFVPCPPRI